MPGAFSGLRRGCKMRPMPGLACKMCPMRRGQLACAQYASFARCAVRAVRMYALRECLDRAYSRLVAMQVRAMQPRQRRCSKLGRSDHATDKQPNHNTLHERNKHSGFLVGQSVPIRTCWKSQKGLPRKSLSKPVIPH